jgi:hypothetical protein
VHPALFTNASTWSAVPGSSLSAGPAVAGLLASAAQQCDVIYIFDAVAAITFLVLMGLIHEPVGSGGQGTTLGSGRGLAL